MKAIHIRQTSTRLTALALAAATLLAGCGTQQSMESARANLDRERKVAREQLDQGRAQAATAAVTRHGGPRLNGLEVEARDARETLPAVLTGNFEYRTASQTFDQVLADIARTTGLSVRNITPSQQNQSQGFQSAQQGFGQSAMPAPFGSSQAAAQAVGYQWSGPLRGFLDSLARSKGLYWSYDAKRMEVSFFAEETRSFAVFVPSGDKSVSASIALAGADGGSSGGSGGGGGASGGGGGGGGGGGSSGNVSVSSSSRINAFQSVVDGVRGFLTQSSGQNGMNGLGLGSGGAGAGGAQGGASGSNGRSGQSGLNGTVVANEGLGMVTVTATPPVLDRIQAYIDTLNGRFARNVFIGVRVYNLTVDDSAVNGISIQAALANAAGTRGLDTRPPGQLTPDSGTAGQFTLRLGNRYGDVDIVAQALRTLGNVSLQTSGQVVAANGQPAPFQVADDQTYLQSSSTTVVPNVGVTTTLSPATVTVGMTANFVPLLLGDNRVLLQYQLNLSTATFSEVTSGNSKIQTPRISRQALQQQAFVEDGETLVLFGFEQSRNVDNATSGILGMSAKGGTSRSMVVIVMDVYADAKAQKRMANNG